MDRRYKEMRFYNGVKASSKGADAAEKLVASYMSKARSLSRKNADYGGSTGGIKSIDKQATGLRIRKDAASRQADARRVFDQEGIGRFGANKEAWIARQYEDDKRKAMEDKQFGREEE